MELLVIGPSRFRPIILSVLKRIYLKTITKRTYIPCDVPNFDDTKHVGKYDSVVRIYGGYNSIISSNPIIYLKDGLKSNEDRVKRIGVRG